MKKFSRICVVLLLFLSLLLPCIPVAFAYGELPSDFTSGEMLSDGQVRGMWQANSIVQMPSMKSNYTSFDGYVVNLTYYNLSSDWKYPPDQCTGFIFSNTSYDIDIGTLIVDGAGAYCGIYFHKSEAFPTGLFKGGPIYVDFGPDFQTVVKDSNVYTSFYDWFTANFSPVSSGPVTGAVTVYTTDGSYEITDFEGTFPVSVAVTDTGLSFYWADDSSSVYQFDGTDIFTGVSLSANESEPRYTVGYTFTMESPGSLYIHTEDPPVTDLQLWDSTGSNMIVEYPGGFPLIVVVTDTGLNLSFDDMYFVYTYSGSDDFYGVALSPGLSAPTYRSGDRFTLTDPVKLYVYTDSGSTGTDPTDPEETDPSETDPTDPTENPLDQEKGEANNQGNSSVDQVIDIIPDYSDNFLGAIQKLADALGYQGTRAVLPTPEISIPAMPGLFPEMVVLQSNEIDFEYWCNQIPIVWMTLIRALFDIALVLFCFKELYSLVEFAISLRSSRKVGED